MEWIRNGFKVGPNYCPPPAPVAEEWIEATDAHVQNRHLQDWWRVFEDPGLNSFINQAYDQNLTLRIAGTRVLEARAQQAIAVGTIFPQAQQATGQYSRVGLSRNMANNPAAINQVLAQGFSNNPALLSSIPASEIPTSWFSDWSAGFNLSWELDFWGRFRRAIESANANLDASVDNYDDALVTLLADVATNYVEYRVAQQRIKIARDNARIQEGVLALVEKQFKVGINKVTRLDVEQSRTLLEQTRSTIPALQIVLGQANDALCVLLGLPVRDLEPALGPGPELGTDPMSSTPTWVAAGIPADLLRRRPDVRSAERQVAAQSAQIGVAEADLYPSLFVNGTIGVEAQDLSKLFESKSFMGTITPNFRWNILNYGRIVNNVRLQDVRTQELIATYQNRVLTADREVQDALRGFLRSREQAEDLARSVVAAKAATQLVRQQLEAGTADLNRVFTLETTQVQQQDQLAVVQGNIALNLINVYRALGGGWELRFEREAGMAAPPLDAAGHGAAPADCGLEQLPPLSPAPRAR
ncbi:MAG TPA: efflux transporter outer membrane subunit [Gemmataceae bacterium]|jgi:NodT family efflux transporter outer membrane factor (OMF) lipoprotein|nr:efflux transporter outer membrane subunit [Gemmataceae bacterium]